MSTEIYYFSGTGNSLYVAKELQKRIPDCSLIPMVSLLNKEVIQAHSKSIGFIFPVHALTIPLAVKIFLKKIDMNSAEYSFAIVTRLGIIFRDFKKIDKLLKKKNKHLDSHFILNMYSNDVEDKHYKNPTEADILKLEAVVQERLNLIQDIIVNKKISRGKDSDYLIALPYNRPVNYLLEKLVHLAMTFSEYTGGVDYFCSDSQCTGCGICEKVCLSQKIKMIDEKPVWQKKVICYMCYACINFCPAQSVQINNMPGVVKSYTRINGRYPHPYAKVKDITGEKQ